MKNLLKSFLTITLLLSSTTTIVACSNKANIDNNIDLENWDNQDIKYELFNKQFDSRTNAVNYYLNNENEVTNIQDYKNEILLSNTKYDNLETMYQDIDSNAGIKKLITQKNPDHYLIDSLGSVSNNAVTNVDDLISVQKNANNKIVYDDSQESATQKVLKSYYEKIVPGYEADGIFFRSVEEIKSYYQQKYLEDNNLEEKLYFRVGNFWYTQENYDKKIDESILKTINYNDVIISEENRFNLDRFDLTKSDQKKITEIEKRPGMYYIEANPEDDGHLEIDGGNFQKSTENITDMLQDIKNWEKTSSKNTGLGDAIMNSAVVGLSMTLGSLGFYDTMQDGSLQKVSSFFDSVDKYNKKYQKYIKAQDEFFPNKNVLVKTKTIDNQKVEDILKKYQIDGMINNLWANLDNMSELDQNKKVIIILYNIRELMRGLETQTDDKFMLDEFFYQTLRSLNVYSFNKHTKDNNHVDLEMSSKWVTLVEEAQADNNVYSVLDLLMDPNYLNQKRVPTSTANSFKEYVDFATAKKDELMKYLELINNILEKVGNAIASVAKVGKVLSKGLVWFSAATELLNSIPLQNTSTYQFLVPDTKNKIVYQKTSWIWDLKEFDPKKIVTSLQISKPINAKTYLYNETYFNLYEDAVNKLKTDIVDKLFADNNQVKYASKFFEQLFETDKKVLKEKIIELTDLKIGYTNGFGEIKDNKSDAINSAIERITEGSFESAYKYDNLGINIYGNDLEAVKSEVNKVIVHNSKTVEFTDILTTQNFDELFDLNHQSYELYYFAFNGKSYYFRDYNSAVIMYMKLNDFENSLIKTTESIYKFRGITFNNINDFTQYLYSNIKEVK